MIPQRGRYELFADGAPCGEERWRIVMHAGGGAEAGGEQETRVPHPIPSRTTWRATLSSTGRVTAVEIDWQVGARHLHASHRAEGERWHVRVEHQGHTREQSGDCPAACEILFGSHVFHQLALSRYAWGPGAEHVFPALVIGPPWMAVEPGRQRVVCTDDAERDTPMGRRPARRLEVHDLAGSAPPFAMWVDAEDRVIESFEGLDERLPWMRLAEWSGPPA